CFTVSSAGGRRGAQMATFDVQHPDVFDFIKAKREDGRLRQFNLSILITEAFIAAVKNDEQWKLVFPTTNSECRTLGLDMNDDDAVIWREWPLKMSDYIVREDGLVACRVYRVVPAQRLWNAIMAATYDFAEPG